MQIEYKIGDVFPYKGIKLECKETKTDDCRNEKEKCYFAQGIQINCKHLNCSCETRSDEKSVIFMEV